MRKILISIRPKYVKEILNLRKTLEIRKSAPKCELPCEVYIYCTKGSTYLYELFNHRYSLSKIEPPNSLNGKVVAKFTLTKTYLLTEEKNGYVAWCGMPCLDPTKEACVSQDDLRGYLKGKDGYAWLIDQKSLKIFDKPKELKEFEFPNPSGVRYIGQRAIKGLPNKKHPPQSWCYCEVDQ